jgi:hypothetical protein
MEKMKEIVPAPSSAAVDEKEEETEEERERRLKEYRKRRAEEQAASGKKLRKLRKLPRYLLVNRVKNGWDRFRSGFSAEHNIKPKALSNMTLRSLLVTGQPCRPIR